MVLNTKQIMEILPHRAPFLLVDRIDELEPGRRAVGCKAVSYNEPFFAGHFPQEPVMPGVLICEALAQVGAVALLSCEEYKGKLALFAYSLSFTHPVRKERMRFLCEPPADEVPWNRFDVSSAVKPV